MESKTNGTIRTYSNILYNVLNPNPDDVRIEDIAHGLSNLCRFAGQCREFYPVAQHSIYVSYMLENCNYPLHVVLYGLHHDDSEAYCIDMPRPIKHSGLVEEYRDIEDRNMIAVELHFGLSNSPAVHAFVKEMDRRVCATEQRDLFDFDRGEEWKREHCPFRWHVKPMRPKQAEAAFLRRHRELTGQLTMRDKVILKLQKLFR